MRRAKYTDIPKLLEMGRRFFDATVYSKITTLNEHDLEAVFISIIDGGVLLVNDEVTGMIGALIYPFYFNKDHLTAQEIFWWVEPESRGTGGALLEALESELKRMSIKTLSMMSTTLEVDRLKTFYEKRGYFSHEHAYIKVL